MVAGLAASVVADHLSGGPLAPFMVAIVLLGVGMLMCFVHYLLCVACDSARVYFYGLVKRRRMLVVLLRF